MRQVCGPVQLRICLDDVPSLVGVPVDEGCDAWQLGNDVYGVLQVGLPVVELVDALGIGCRKLTAGLHTKICVQSETLSRLPCNHASTDGRGPGQFHCPAFT